MSKMVYTCIIDDYDTLKDPVIITPGWEYVCFTDDENLKSDVWDIRIIEKQEEANKTSKHVKIRPWEYFDNFEYALWIDASFQLVKDLNTLAIPLISNDLSTTPHPRRESVYEEAKRCIKLGKDAERVKQQMNYYYQAEPESINKRVYENGVLLWRNTPNAEELSIRWWNEVDKYSERDQLSLPVAIFNSNARIGEMDHDYKMSYVTNMPHKSKENTRVYYFTPYDRDKNWGKAINDHCELVPNDDDWICILDRDTMFLTNDYGTIIEDAILRYPDTDLFGCITNRLSLHWQVHDQISSDNPDIRKHLGIAKARAEKFAEYSTVSNRYIGGLFMLFKKSTWKKNKFREGLVHNMAFIDYYFSQGVLNQGGTIRVIEGLYIYHNYRLKEQEVGFEHLRTDKEEGYELDPSKITNLDEAIAVFDLLGINLSELSYNRLEPHLKHYFK